MKQLPGPKTYEEEFKYMPWGKLIAEVLEICRKDIPRDSSVLDLMCGPGYLLNKLSQSRKDLKLTGVDIDQRYINYAKKNYQRIKFIKANSLSWSSKEKFDVVLCTAGLHHVPYNKQGQFLRKIRSHLKRGALCIIADPYVSKYRNEKERRLAASELGLEYLRAVLNNGAPDSIVSATIDILHNDVLPKGEYKTYLERVLKMLSKHFITKAVKKIWPNVKSEYGDYYLYLTAK